MNSDAEDCAPRFRVDPAFAASSRRLTSLALSEVLLQLDARWPWLVLVPRVAAARELEDLTKAERGLLMEEVVAAGRAVRAMGDAAGRSVVKLNVGALGNITPRLHVHVVGRRPDDPAWPGPVWGVGDRTDYDDLGLRAAKLAARAALAG